MRPIDWLDLIVCVPILIALDATYLAFGITRTLLAVLAALAPHLSA